MTYLSNIVIPVHGTWALRETIPWWKHGSNFHFLCIENDCDYPPEIFYWSSDVNGIGLASLFGIKTNYNDWDAGAFSLRQYLRWFDYNDRNLICHSHALQLALRCDYPIRRLISIGSPVRMETDTHKYRTHIGQWLHIYEEGWDRIQWIGQIGDGRFGGGKETIHADFNVKIKGISHSKILKNEEYYEHWIIRHWFDFLKGKKI